MEIAEEVDAVITALNATEIMGKFIDVEKVMWAICNFLDRANRRRNVRLDVGMHECPLRDATTDRRSGAVSYSDVSADGCWNISLDVGMCVHPFQ